MKTCSYCGHESPEDASACSGCGASPIVPRLAAPLPDPIPVGATVEDESEEALCPSCLKSNRPGAGFCENCGGIIGACSGLAPLEAAWNKGHGNPRALDTRPKTLILIVVWLIFCPWLVASLLAIGSLMGSRGLEGATAVMILFLMGWIGLCAYVLVWNTWNYYRRRHATPPPLNGNAT